MQVRGGSVIVRNHCAGIGQGSIHKQLQVQVVAGGVAGGTHRAKLLALGHCIASCHAQGIQVGIQRAVTVAVRQGAVVDHHIIAVTEVVVGNRHRAVIHCQHRRTFGGAVIRSVVTV